MRWSWDLVVWPIEQHPIQDKRRKVHKCWVNHCPFSLIQHNAHVQRFWSADSVVFYWCTNLSGKRMSESSYPPAQLVYEEDWRTQLGNAGEREDARLMDKERELYSIWTKQGFIWEARAFQNYFASAIKTNSPSPLIHTPTGVVYTYPADMNTLPCVPYSGQSESKSTHSILTNLGFSSTRHAWRPSMDRSKPKSIHCRDILCGCGLGKGRKMRKTRPCGN